MHYRVSVTLTNLDIVRWNFTRSQQFFPCHVNKKACKIIRIVDKTRWAPICCVCLPSPITSYASDPPHYLYYYDKIVSVLSRLHQLSTYLSSLDAGTNRARQLYKNISMLFLFPVIDGKLSTGVNATFDASCYG